MPSTWILGIETSCDETSASVVRDGSYIASNIVASQIPIHRQYGGVVPEVASRQHLEKITYVVDKAVDDAGLGLDDIDGVAVTVGPGLIGALLVGVAAAKAYSYALNIPLIPVHHLEAHLYANFLSNTELVPPLLCLVVSGGHTSLILLKDHLEYEIMGTTRDDAAGEAFDKIARVLGLPYPGGPALEELASQGDPQAVHFPRAWLSKDSLEFSFSGLKTAVMNYMRDKQRNEEAVSLPDVAASFQAAVVEVLVVKTILAAKKSGVRDVCLAGGVAANSTLRGQFQRAADQEGLRFYFPEKKLCTDNAAMVACAGYFHYLAEEFGTLAQEAYANYPLINA
ncbi:MAG: tRNA (adenosine(37)-N6)-threonylcarbamoyltransferase complex transferase subunit TsaD [Syntrophaceticus sp.]|nr:tRNA (adenosine(37)-N6)-threonylcarbamoyltransferase complex transferase subunit TsaD [Syntrophaceticus sp.]MDD4360072.1 tRNA (adenosine(37)-N6)-threonylcarbamoyltransferase complex transferase subunit TsaD [Syntrophaceticus sp.]MDD4783339.1 tRNA (adenosine(37)-N6)-threonylcarbamoyltransferase complex transferase subunit TsaD [Syntrophaceticus sp.]